MAALRAEPLDECQADLVQRMSGSLVALETMFNLLLDISRIDAGATTPASRSFALRPLLRRLADEFAPQLEARGLRLALLVVTGESDWQALRAAGHDCLPKPLAPALLARWLAEAGQELGVAAPTASAQDRMPKTAPCKC